MGLYEGIYLHIPFCRQKCLYCDFPSYAGLSETIKENYVRALCREIRTRAPLEEVVPGATVFVGGGTPSVLSAEQLERITSALRRYNFWRKPREATIEVNPGTVDAEKLRGLKRMGFDRVSFGVQSLNDDELAAIGRIHSAAEALEAIRLAREAGFRRINCDVISGLPGQTLPSLRETLNKLLETGLTHLSVYSLIVEEGTPLAATVRAGILKLPDEDAELELYEFTQKFLERGGLRRYEISNYSVPGEESRHNLLYWNYRPYLGFGAAATGFDGRSRRTNTASVKRYCENPADSYATETLNDETRLEEFIFMGLRTVRGVSIAEAEKRFGVNLLSLYKNELEKFSGEKLLSVEDGRISLTELGMRFGNFVFEAFVKV